MGVGREWYAKINLRDHSFLFHLTSESCPYISTRCSRLSLSSLILLRLHFASMAICIMVLRFFCLLNKNLRHWQCKLSFELTIYFQINYPPLSYAHAWNWCNTSNSSISAWIGICPAGFLKIWDENKKCAYYSRSSRKKRTNSWCTIIGQRTVTQDNKNTLDHIKFHVFLNRCWHKLMINNQAGN